MIATEYTPAQKQILRGALTAYISILKRRMRVLSPSKDFSKNQQHINDLITQTVKLLATLQ